MEFLSDPTIVGTGSLAFNSNEELDDEEDQGWICGDELIQLHGPDDGS